MDLHYKTPHVADAQLHDRMDAADARVKREADARRVMLIALALFVTALFGVILRGAH